MKIAMAAVVAASAVIAWWITLHLGGAWLAYAVTTLAAGGIVAVSRLIANGRVL